MINRFHWNETGVLYPQVTIEEITDILELSWLNLKLRKKKAALRFYLILMFLS